MAKLGCTTKGIVMNDAVVIFLEAGGLICPLQLNFSGADDGGMATQEDFVPSSEEAK